MATSTGIEIIALEEHYWDPIMTDHYVGRDASRRGPVQDRLYDVEALRLKEMDDAGIDIQVLSHGAPSAQKFDAQSGPEITKQANDKLYETVQKHPDRYFGFAALATAHPESAADELERCVKDLGFKGAMIHGLTNGEFNDSKKYWPIYARAEALDVPIYLHPGYPHEDVVKAYYQDYLEDFPALAGPGWGYTVETATQAIRMILSGVFDEYPKLQMILGHMGESLPFLLWRVNQALSRVENTQTRSFREIFEAHFHVTTSGNFSNPALLCTVQEMGIDRIMFSVDYPFVENQPGRDWAEQLNLSLEDRRKLLNGNVRKLLRL
ncbi:MAG: amidohydrolase [Rhodospirillaceae bacterium]|nr:amidohydrolase [Rhodospirillaceae bacterium]|tara:strand:+ start:2717 stop:3685 length:969 start_codon:yes stop_codon:yes gene_type:complete